MSLGTSTNSYSDPHSSQQTAGHCFGVTGGFSVHLQDEVDWEAPYLEVPENRRCTIMTIGSSSFLPSGHRFHSRFRFRFVASPPLSDRPRSSFGGAADPLPPRRRRGPHAAGRLCRRQGRGPGDVARSSENDRERPVRRVRRRR